MHVDYCVTVICVSKKRDKLASTLSLFFPLLSHTHIQTFLARTCVGVRAVCSLAIYKKIRFPFARRTRRFCPSSDTLPNITLERQNIVITIDHSVCPTLLASGVQWSRQPARGAATSRFSQLLINARLARSATKTEETCLYRRETRGQKKWRDLSCCYTKY